ncbi:TetR/AcrR family transcriptional regulator [Caulobacter sp. HMWF009]|nr:TetR/AcrR family transcriptional regulator [Caulobacter sp. HMWF009]PTT13109.1 TetR/AcrR family transcriptional regulator [Caulobacter sp. HMWF025]
MSKVSRPRGSRDADHEAKRRDLLGRMATRLMSRTVARPSLRDLAAAAEVSVPTLRHYFGSRQAVVDAVMAECLRRGREGLEALRHSDLPFADSIRLYADSLVRALQAPRDVVLGDVFAVSLAEGVMDPDVGISALNHIIEPTLQVLEARLQVHVQRGEMIPVDVRAAGLMLLSPLLLASLHQNQLQGSHVRPLALEALAAAVSDGFVRAYGRGGPGPVASA